MVKRRIALLVIIFILITTDAAGLIYILNSSFPDQFTNVNGTLYFTAFKLPYGRELWKSDGTWMGTRMVKDIYPGMHSGLNSGLNSLYPSSFIYGFLGNINDTLYFTADDGIHGVELWKSDGTWIGTRMVKAITPPHDGGSYKFSCILNGILYFAANDGGIYGYQMWKTDGTEDGTVMVTHICRGAGGVGFKFLFLINVNGTLYFAIETSEASELWKSDGTEAGTVMVKEIHSLNENKSAFININDTLYFVARDGIHGMELWKSDGTEAGTVMVKDIGTGMFDSSPFFLTELNGMLYFSADDGSLPHGRALWKSDGTEAGTVKLLNKNLGFLTKLKDTLYFSTNDYGGDNELWKSDGTKTGTVMIKYFGNDVPYNLTYLNDMLYFLTSPNRANNDWKLWKSDETEAGTVMVKEMNIKFKSWAGYMININDTLYFAANDGIHGVELWKSDGTWIGTRMVKDIEKLWYPVLGGPY